MVGKAMTVGGWGRRLRDHIFNSEHKEEAEN